MKFFECQVCSQPLFFENSLCEGCDRKVGFLSSKMTMTALEPCGEHWKALADPYPDYVYCGNLAFDGCNWLVPADGEQAYCAACRHNRTIPDLSDQRNLILWRRIEVAKRRLFYSLLRLRLPLRNKTEDRTGLAFDFLAPTKEPVMTGHLEGVITINLAEADDSEREKQRGIFDEPYRTLLGHFRHEIAHYYWDRVVRDSGSIEEFRKIFGDERVRLQGITQPPPFGWSTRGLAKQFRYGLREFAPMGRLRGNLGALFSHGRYLGDGQSIWSSHSAACRGCGAGCFCRIRSVHG